MVLNIMGRKIANEPGMAPAAFRERLRVLELALGYDVQSHFAEAIGLHPNTWNSYYLRGSMPDDAKLLIIKVYPDITFDWIARGRREGLTQAALRAIDRAAEALAGRAEAPRRGRPRTRR
jgi:hypothetical protein